MHSQCKRTACSSGAARCSAECRMRNAKNRGDFERGGKRVAQCPVQVVRSAGTGTGTGTTVGCYGLGEFWGPSRFGTDLRRRFLEPAQRQAKKSLAIAGSATCVYGPGTGTQMPRASRHVCNAIRIKPHESGANGAAAAFVCSGFSAASMAVILFKCLQGATPACLRVCSHLYRNRNGCRKYWGTEYSSAKPVRYHVLLG